MGLCHKMIGHNKNFITRLLSDLSINNLFKNKQQILCYFLFSRLGKKMTFLGLVTFLIAKCKEMKIV